MEEGEKGGAESSFAIGLNTEVDEKVVVLPPPEEDWENRVNVDRKAGESVKVPSEEVWRAGLIRTINNGVSFEDLGFKVNGWVESSDSPFGDFVRSHCLSTQPPLSAELCYERKGDLLPIHPECLRPGSLGITVNNVHWVQLAIYALNFSYCCGWTKPICVPIGGGLTDNQKKAVSLLAEQIDRTVAISEKVPKMGKLTESLNSKRFDYSGNPVEHMLELDARKVIDWRSKGLVASS